MEFSNRHFYLGLIHLHAIVLCFVFTIDLTDNQLGVCKSYHLLCSRGEANAKPLVGCFELGLIVNGWKFKPY